MSEKRFIWKCDDENCQIYDTKKKKAYFNVEVVDLLNEQQDTINDLNSELEKSSTFIIEQRKENRQLHYQIIELQDKLGMSEKQHDLKQIIELQNENIISKKKIKDLQVSLFLQSKELERQKKK